MTVYQECKDCKGTGRVSSQRCTTCGGSGRSHVSDEVAVVVQKLFQGKYNITIGNITIGHEFKWAIADVQDARGNSAQCLEPFLMLDSSDIE